MGALNYWGQNLLISSVRMKTFFNWRPLASIQLFKVPDLLWQRFTSYVSHKIISPSWVPPSKINLSPRFAMTKIYYLCFSQKNLPLMDASIQKSNRFVMTKISCYVFHKKVFRSWVQPWHSIVEHERLWSKEETKVGEEHTGGSNSDNTLCCPDNL